MQHRHWFHLIIVLTQLFRLIGKFAVRINVSCIGSVMLPSFQEASPCHLPCNVWCSLQTWEGCCICKSKCHFNHFNQRSDLWPRVAGASILDFTSPSPVADFGDGDNGLQVCPLPLSGILWKRGGQLFNVGLKTSRSASVSGQRSQWTDLSPRLALREGMKWVVRAGSRKTKEKEP